jgi:hypothetical protein
MVSDNEEKTGERNPNKNPQSNRQAIWDIR